MKYFYDCEFLEDGKTIKLISIGIINEIGQEYYAVNEDMPIEDIRQHEWLEANVWPHLPLIDKNNPHSDLDRTSPLVKPYSTIADEVRDFLLSDNEGEDNRQLWAWYGDYDHVVLCWLWGPMVNLPKGIPMFTRDLKQRCDDIGNPRLPKQTDGEHSAIGDARHNLVRARALGLISYSSKEQ